MNFSHCLYFVLQEDRTVDGYLNGKKEII